MLVAKQLVTVGTITKNKKFLEYAEKAMNYTLAAQNDNGSWYYWGKPDTLLYNIDSPHTGYLLRSLYQIYKVNESKSILDAIIKGLNYLTKNFIGEHYEVSLFPNAYNYIFIYGCAEMILCLSTLSELFPDYFAIARKVANWAITNMRDEKSGYFHYRIYHSLHSKIPFIRKGQALMLRALTELYRKELENS